MKSSFIIALLGVLFCFPAHADTPIQVVASFSILGDMVEKIGGPDVVVKTLVGPDSDTHSYDPTPEDAKIISKSKLLFINGLGYEGWMSRLALASSFRGKIIVVSEGVKPRTLHETKNGEPTKSLEITLDPHAWQDPNNGIIYVQNIARALIEILPDKKQEIALRSSQYIQSLNAIDHNIRNELSAIPLTNRRIITSHDAFGYFGDAYGIKFIAPQGVNTETEPSVMDITQLLKQIKSEGIQTIFIENMTNPRLAEALAHEGGIKIGDRLYSDALSSSDGPAATYLDLFHNNVPKMLAALRQTAP